MKKLAAIGLLIASYAGACPNISGTFKTNEMLSNWGAKFSQVDCSSINVAEVFVDPNTGVVKESGAVTTYITDGSWHQSYESDEVKSRYKYQFVGNYLQGIHETWRASDNKTVTHYGKREIDAQGNMRVTASSTVSDGTQYPEYVFLLERL